MVRILGWVLVLAIVGMIDFPRLWRSKARYDMWVFGVLLVVAGTYGILYQFDVPLPDPNGLVKLVFGPIGKRFMQPAES